MDYVENVTKDVFFLEQMLRQQQMKRYIQECQILASGEDIPYKLNSLNEDLKESAKGLWTKIKTIFNRIWMKFLERIDHFCKDDASYLKEYQNIILNKKAPEGVYTMPDYTKVTGRVFEKIQDFQSYIPLSFVDELAKRVTEGTTDDNIDEQKRKWEIAIQNAFKPKDMADIKEDTDFSALCKEYYGGGEDEDISADAINMADAYNLCFSAKNVIDELTKTQTAYNKWMQEVETKYNTQYRTVAEAVRKKNEAIAKAQEVHANNGSQEEKDAAANNINAAHDALTKLDDDAKKAKDELDKKKATSQPQQQQQVTNNSYDLYSVVYGRTINEASFSASGSTGGADKKDYVHPTGTSTGSADNATAKTNTDIKNKGKAMRTDSEKQANNAKDQATVSAHDAAKKAEDVSSEAVTKFTTLVTTYTTICTQTISTIFGAKCNAIEKMRRDYMFVIRNHVKYWLGRPDNTDDNVRSVKSPGTNPGGAVGL